MKTRSFRTLALAGMALLLIDTTIAFAEKLPVVASFSILGDIAANIGGDAISLTTLVGPDADAHAYEPRPDDAVAMTKAKVVLVNGLGFEGFMERLAKTSATSAVIVEVSKGIEAMEPEAQHGAEEAIDHSSHDHGAKDPHAFQSVPNVRAYTANIRDAFCQADAINCDTYKANAAAYDQKLAALDTEIRASVAAIPADRRTVITSHDAFGYLAHEYGLTFLAPEGVSTDSEASAGDIAKLIDQIREDKASALFVENISDPRLVTQIASETGIKIGGSLYSDALSKVDGPASTYLDLMRYNIQIIKGAVSGS